MQVEKLDSEYLNIVKDIISDSEFLKLKSCEHHGISRFDHSLKVSYQAYLFGKKHNLNYQSIAVGGLLHDFFLSEDEITKKDKFISTFNHPKKAHHNAKEKYCINAIEEDIIASHMFPINLKVPKYKESWVVSLYDKKIALKEWSSKFNYSIKFAGNLMALILLNFIR